jgi:hypothetical protein
VSELDFDTGVPIWSATVFHNTPNTPGIWGCAVNAHTEREAFAAVVQKYTEEGLDPIRVSSIEIEELKTLGGENGG